jgi:hypothetical protein
MSCKLRRHCHLTRTTSWPVNNHSINLAHDPQSFLNQKHTNNINNQSPNLCRLLRHIKRTNPSGIFSELEPRFAKMSVRSWC